MNFFHRHPLSINARVGLWSLACLSLWTTHAALAQIRTDSSWGRSASSLSGPNYLIPESLGKLAGNNLFQSFSDFNLRGSESATFTTSTAGLQNVVTRVTGGTPSQLNGLLSLQPVSGAPAFYFINPAGVVFGAGAQVAVPGAFHVSTADYVRFGDGRFYANPTASSTLSSAAPEAFGFLGGARASVTVAGGSVLTLAGQALSVVAGDIGLSADGLVGKFGGAGELRLAAVGADALEVPLSGALPAARGALRLSGGARVVNLGLDAEDAGATRISAGDITLEGASGVLARTTASGRGPDILIAASGQLVVSDGAAISSSTTGSARAGDLVVDAQGAVSVLHGNMESLTYGPGDGGTVRINAQSLTLDAQGPGDRLYGISTSTLPDSTGKASALQITTSGELRVLNGALIDASTYASGDAGAIQIRAGSVTIDGQAAGNAAITSTAVSASGGQGGSVELFTPGALVLRNGGQIDSATFSSGNAGAVQVSAGSVAITGGGTAQSLTGIFGFASPGSTGRAGAVTVTTTGDLALSQDGMIDSSAYAAGDAGHVRVRAANILVDGSGRGLTTIGSRALQADSRANAGNIDVAASGDLSLLRGGIIDSSTYSGGNAGSVKVSAANITIDGQHTPKLLSGIFSSAEPGSRGNAGSVEVSTPGLLSIVNRGEIDSTTYGAGNASNVVVRAGRIFIDDLGESGVFTGIFSEATLGSAGHAGSLDVAATDSISVVNGGSIDTLAYATGAAGTVKVSAPRITLDGQSFGYASINSGTQPGSSGAAGSVQIDAGESLTLRNGARIESASAGAGAAGNLAVRAGGLLSLDRSAISTSAMEGNGGNITVDAGGAMLLRRSQLTTSVLGSNGNGGDIHLTARALALQTGFVQANTAASNASGGKVLIEVQALVPSGASVAVGGAVPAQFDPKLDAINIIQAAAPTGLAGTISVASPRLDVAGNLAALHAQLLDAGALARSPCQPKGVSALTQAGHGGLAPSAREFISLDTSAAPTVEPLALAANAPTSTGCMP